MSLLLVILGLVLFSGILLILSFSVVYISITGPRTRRVLRASPDLREAFDKEKREKEDAVRKVLMLPIRNSIVLGQNIVCFYVPESGNVATAINTDTFLRLLKEYFIPRILLIREIPIDNVDIRRLFVQFLSGTIICERQRDDHFIMYHRGRAIQMPIHEEKKIQ